MTDDDVREVRRMKARIERERIPPGEDPQFHLKLGRGSMSDVEFTVQLLQLLHGGDRPELRAPATIDALERLRAAGMLLDDDADVLEEAYRFCERARNARYLQSGAAVRRPSRRSHRARTSRPAPRVRPPAAHHAARRLPPGHPPRASRRRTHLLRRVIATRRPEAVGGTRCDRVGARTVRRVGDRADHARRRRLPAVGRPGVDRAADPRHRAPVGAARPLLAVRVVPSRDRSSTTCSGCRTASPAAPR